MKKEDFMKSDGSELSAMEAIRLGVRAFLLRPIDFIIVYLLPYIVAMAVIWGAMFTENIAIIIIGFFITLFITLYSTAGLLLMIKDLVEGKDIDIINIYSRAGGFIFKIFWTNLLMSILLFLLFLCLVVPGIIFSIFWIFTILIIVFQKKSGMAAMVHSKALVKGRWWKTFGKMLIFLIVVILISIPENLISAFVSEELGILISIITGGLVGIIGMIVMAILYLSYEATAQKQEEGNAVLKTPENNSLDSSFSQEEEKK
jgi:hypothetical protein